MSLSNQKTTHIYLCVDDTFLVHHVGFEPTTLALRVIEIGAFKKLLQSIAVLWIQSKTLVYQ